jgi:tetratricopeptide (TPR) repeat protein
VLDSQERSIEAMRSYLKALQLDPANLSARTNLARALYKAGRWERALEQYQRAVEQYQRLGYGERVDGAVSFTRTDLVSAYQNMAFIAAALGLTDQAVCYAQEARAVGDPLFGELEYARFLISVAKLGSAEEVLQRAILSQGADVAPAYLVDYAVVLTLLGKANLAHENIERVILSDLAESEIQDCAYRLALAIDPQILQPKERDEVCLQSEPLSWSYWPLHLRERIKKRVGEVCERAGVS